MKLITLQSLIKLSAGEDVGDQWHSSTPLAYAFSAEIWQCFQNLKWFIFSALAIPLFENNLMDIVTPIRNEICLRMLNSVLFIIAKN